MLKSSYARGHRAYGGDLVWLHLEYICLGLADFLRKKMSKQPQKRFNSVEEALELIMENAGSVVCLEDSSSDDADLVRPENIDDSGDSDYWNYHRKGMDCLKNRIFIDVFFFLLVSNFHFIYS